MSLQTSPQTVTSPVVPGAPAHFVDALEVPRLIERYRQYYGLDVADYFHGLSQVDIYACARTGYRFYHPFTLAGREDLYAQLALMPGYYTDRPEHAIAERYLRPSDWVLEIGCGAGFFLRRLAARRIAAVGLDLNRAAVAQCRAEGLDARLETIETHAAAHPQAYDAVCTFHVLEHVVDVHAFLTAAIACLRPGGRLIIAVPNSAPGVYGADPYYAPNTPPHHMGLWEPASLRALTRYFPLKVKAVQGIPLEASAWWQYPKWEHYLNFSVQHHPVLLRKRNWLLWNLQRRYVGTLFGCFVEALMLATGPYRELVVIFRRCAAD